MAPRFSIVNIGWNQGVVTVCDKPKLTSYTAGYTPLAPSTSVDGGFDYTAKDAMFVKSVGC